MARDIKLFLIVIAGLCVFLVGLYMQANDRRELRLNKYLDTQAAKRPKTDVGYVDVETEYPRYADEQKVVARTREIKPSATRVQAPQLTIEPAGAVPQGPAESNLPDTQPVEKPAEPVRATPPAMARPRERSYVVKAGDTLGHIASRKLGSAKLWRRLYEANRKVVKNPNALRVGCRLVLPNVGQKGQSTTVAKSDDRRALPMQATLSTISRVRAPQRPPAEPRTRGVDIVAASPSERRLADLTVRERTKLVRQYRAIGGESLAEVARIAYKNEARWRDIYRANVRRIKDPNCLSAGMLLRLPD